MHAPSEADRTSDAAPQQLPKLCAAAQSDCYDLSVSAQRIPLRGDPRFEALVQQYDTVSKPATAASTAPASASPP